MSLASQVSNAIAVLPLDEASGNAIASVGGLDFTDNNTVTSGTGKVHANARLFTAANSEYFSHADNADYSTGDITFGLRVWVKLVSKATNQVIISKREGFEYSIEYGASGDRLKFTFGSGATIATADSFGAVPLDTWLLVHAWHDASSNKIGIAVNNSTEVEVDDSLANPSDGNGAINFGRDPAFDTNFLDGLLNDFVFLKGSYLDGTERTADYNSGTGVPFSSWGGVSTPTLSSPTVPTGGATLTATLSVSGCIPTSGTGGFTLGGTAATVSSWAISGSTLTLTLSGTVYSDETVTYSYDRATTTDDISESTAAAFLANFSGTSVTNSSTQARPLTAGVASFVSSGPGGISITSTSPIGGTPSYTYQWQRSVNGGSYSNLSNGGGVTGTTTLSLVDGSATAGNAYRYKLVTTDSAGSPATVTSNIAGPVYLYTGGALTGGLLVGGGMTGGIQRS